MVGGGGMLTRSPFWMDSHVALAVSGSTPMICMRGQGDALSVITGRERHDAAAPLVGAQREQLVESAADLERAGALEVFALEEDTEAAGVVPRLRRDHGCARDAIEQSPGGGVNVVERETAHGGGLSR